MKQYLKVLEDQKPLNRISLLTLLIGAAIGYGLHQHQMADNIVLTAIGLLTITMASSIRIAQQWERAIVL